MKERKVDFKFDGDMQPDVALNKEYKELYPMSDIVGSANVLIMPGQHSAAISYKIMKSMSSSKVIGPLLIGLGAAIEIAPLRCLRRNFKFSLRSSLFSWCYRLW